jgi:hypothetical protein
MDKESIRSILANISEIANVPPLNDEKIEEAIAMLDIMVIEEKGPGFSIEAPAYPLSELPYYLDKSGAVNVKFSSEMRLTDFTRFARPVTEAELTKSYGLKFI